MSISQSNPNQQRDLKNKTHTATGEPGMRRQRSRVATLRQEKELVSVWTRKPQ